MKKIKAFSYVALVVLLVLMSVIGCRPAEEKPNVPYNGNDMNNNNYNNGNIEDDDGIIDGDDIGNDMYDMNNNDVGRRSEMIAGKLVELNGIDRAAVVISDNTAIVGVDTTNNNGVGNGIAEDLRGQIESTVRNVDNRINEVRITSDEDVYGRINDIVLDMRTGRPVTEFTNEIRDILDRITNMD